MTSLTHRHVLTVVLWFTISAQAADGPLSPEEALKSFRLEPGLRVELVACEPTVVDPVAMAFDEYGHLFVAENRGYPTGPKPGELSAGIIARLEDVDGDGKFEKRTVFAEGLTFPNGVLPWKGGLIVTCAPDILYLQDTNYDGRADLRDVWFTGFDPSNTTQLRVSHPTLSPDNWVYVTSGLVSAKIRRPGATNVIETKTDFRFRPDLTQWEAAEGRGQFGLTFDDFGRRFICMNRVHVQHVVMPSRYLRRNSSLSAIEPVQDCPESMEPEPLPGHKAAARIYPISDNITTADSHAGTFTAACGVMVYRGTALPPRYRGHVFACDPAANLVHWDELRPSGSTFVARRADSTNEFLASTDNWFRPVFLANGPDGALYVCDMYRKTIEHPQYLPEEIRKRTDFESGKDKGRIYRITGTDLRKLAIPKRDAKGWVELLDHQDGWWRETAHRILLERKEQSIAHELKVIAAKSAPQGRVHALNLLDALGGLDNSILATALRNESLGVRENALRLSESRLSGEVFKNVVKLADDPDSHVRFQCALSLGETSRKEIVEPLIRITQRDSKDRWTRTAVLSSLWRHDELFLEKFLSVAKDGHPEGTADFLRELGRVMAQKAKAGKPPSVVSQVVNSAEPETAISFLAGYLERAQLTISNAAIFSHASRIAGDKGKALAQRSCAVQVLSEAPLADAQKAILPLLAPNQPPLLQAVAARVLARRPEAESAIELLEASRWISFQPSLRSAVVSTLLAEPRTTLALLAAIENNVVSTTALTATQRKQLTESKNPQIKERSKDLFGSSKAGDRMNVFEDYKFVLSLAPNPANGRAVFRKHCASCHRLDREGVPVGPDLFGIRNQQREVILLHIIVPEYEIAPNFANYIVHLKNDRETDGMIVSESDSHIRLRRALGEEETVQRNDIAEIRSSGLSLMPQELEKNMTRQEMADLIAYLKGM